MGGCWITASAPAFWGVTLAALQLVGCSSMGAAPRSAVGNEVMDQAAAPTEAPKGQPKGVGDLVEKPVVQVDQVDNAWGVPLARIADKARREAIARDLDALITRRARSGVPAPAQAELIVASPQLVLLIATPAGLRAGLTRTLLVVAWDTSGESAPLVSARFAGAEAASLGPPRQQGAGREHRFRLTAERAGQTELALQVRRGASALSAPKLTLEVGAAEQP